MLPACYLGRKAKDENEIKSMRYGKESGGGGDSRAQLMCQYQALRY